MSKIKKKLLIFIFPIVVFLFFAILTPRFSLKSFPIVAIQSIIPTMIGFALYQCMAGGMFDLSVGARIILSSFIGGLLGMKYGVIALVLGCILSGVILGAATGLLYTVTKIPSMVLAMCLILVFEPLPFLLFNSSSVSVEQPLAYLGKTPYNIIILFSMFCIFYLISNHTKYSCHIRAVGSEEIIAKTIGINTKRTKFKAYVVSGLFCGVASILYMCYSNNISAQSSLGSINLVFKSLMGVMIAIELTAYINIGMGIFIGEFCITTIFNGMIALGMPDTMQDMVLGLFLLLVIAFTSNKKAISYHFKSMKLRESEIIKNKI